MLVDIPAWLTKLVQIYLRESGEPISVDGVYGPQTALAMERQPVLIKNEFREAITDAGFVLPTVLRTPDLNKLFVQTRQNLDVPMSYLKLIVSVENFVVGDYVFVEFTGTFKGLGQFNETTWNSVMDIPFSRVTESDKSLEAVARLYIANRDYHRKQHPTTPFTDEIAYLYHNQGASGASHFIKTGVLRFPKQSSHALRVFAKAKDIQNENVSSSTFA